MDSAQNQRRRQEVAHTCQLICDVAAISRWPCYAITRSNRMDPAHPHLGCCADSCQRTKTSTAFRPGIYSLSTSNQRFGRQRSDKRPSMLTIVVTVLNAKTRMPAKAYCFGLCCHIQLAVLELGFKGVLEQMVCSMAVASDLVCHHQVCEPVNVTRGFQHHLRSHRRALHLHKDPIWSLDKEESSTLLAIV